MKHIICLSCLVLIALSLAGCGPSTEDLATQVKTEYDKQLQQNSAPFSCTKVTLVHEEGNKYSGIAELSNGAKATVSVTHDGKNIVWQALPMINTFPEAKVP